MRKTKTNLARILRWYIHKFLLCTPASCIVIDFDVLEAGVQSMKMIKRENRFKEE